MALATLVGTLGIAPAADGASGTECPNEAFRSGPSALLPDCRAYEQATSVDKNGGGAEGAIGVVKASSAGDGITFFSQAGVPGGVGAQEFPSFIASRGDSEWSTAGLLPPQALGNKANVRGLSPNLRYVVTEAIKSGTAPAESGSASLLIEDTKSHEIRTIVPYTEARINAFVLTGVSNDGSYVFFEAKVPLGSGLPLGRQNLFVWRRATGEVSLIGVPPKEKPAFTGSFAGPYNWVQGFLTEGGAFANYYVAEDHAISESGDRAYFTARTTGQLYLRQGLTGGEPSTVQVSASQKTNGAGENGTDPNGPKPAAFLAATQEGSRVFFMSHEELTNDADTGSEDQGNDLYMHEVATGKLTDLTASSTETPNGAEVQGLLGISANGSVVYFVANGVLAPGATPGDCHSLEEGGGTCNLYRYDDSSGTPQITFITRFHGPTFGAEFRNGEEIRNWSPISVQIGAFFTEPTARVSADGNTLLFRSVQPLTGYDNFGCDSNTEGNEEGRCPELYRYSADTSEIVCVSCGPAGTPPVGPASLRSVLVDAFVSGKVAGTLPTMTRNLSTNGDRVFFETPDGLVPADVNGEEGCQFTAGSTPSNNSCQDVYEWEAQGTGSCVVAMVPGGCVYLISSGQSRVQSSIADIDATGENVFFFTESQLVPVDKDQLVDIYDARADGGLASQHPLPATACVGEACQGGSTPAPSASQPGSATLLGPPSTLSTPTPSARPGSSTRVSPSSGRHKRTPKKKPPKRAKKCKKRGTQCKSKLSSHRRGARSAHANRGGVR